MLKCRVRHLSIYKAGLHFLQIIKRDSIPGNNNPGISSVLLLPLLWIQILPEGVRKAFLHDIGVGLPGKGHLLQEPFAGVPDSPVAVDLSAFFFMVLLPAGNTESVCHV